MYSRSVSVPDESLPLLDNPKARGASVLSRPGPQLAVRRWRSFLSHPSTVVLATTGLQRFAFYGLTANLSAFLGTSNGQVSLGLDSETLELLVLLFSQLPFVGAFVGGTLADCLVKRFRVYLYALAFQLVGSLFLLVSAVLQQRGVQAVEKDPGDESHRRLLMFFVFAGLSCLAIGIALSSGTDVPLGVDQYQPGVHEYEAGAKNAMKYFPRYYFVINVASMLSYTVLSFVQMNYNFAWGFTPIVVSYLAAIFCLLGFRRKIYEAPISRSDSALYSVYAMAREAWRTKPASSERLSWEERAVYNGKLTAEKIRELRRLGGVVGVLLSLVFYMATYFQVCPPFCMYSSYC